MWMVYRVINVGTEEPQYYITNGQARELIQIVLDAQDGRRLDGTTMDGDHRIDWGRPLSTIERNLYGEVEVWADLKKTTRELGTDED